MTDDDRLARDLASEAGDLLLALRAEGGEPDALRKAGDRQSHEFLAAQLSRQRPGDAVLSEEGRDDLARLAADRVWIVDPLDGTREFGEPGRADWAVHVALWERGHLTAGAVALPAQGRMLSTAEPPPTPPAMTPGQPVRVLVSRTRPPALLDRLAREIELTLIPLGSAGAKAAEVIRGAPMPMCTAAASTSGTRRHRWRSPRRRGCTRRGWTGQSSPTIRPDPSLPDILICSAGLAPVLLDGLRVAGCSSYAVALPQGE